MNVAGMKVLVVGLGKTGEALVRFLAARGARVSVSEKKTEEELGKKILVLREKGILVETGGHRLPTFLEADMIIPSPGVAALPELEAAKRTGTPILSEVELAYRFLKGRLVGITGTNGKSTTATLAHKLLKDAGLRSYLAGNIGTPLISFVEKSRTDHIYVTEISSFQLEHIDRLKVDLAVFLNISLNHLDWHASFDDYFRAKKKLVLAQGKDDTTVLNRDDRLVWALSKETKAKIYSFSARKEIRRGCFIKDGWIILRDRRDRSDREEKRLIKTSAIPLPGLHNQENVMAAAVIGHCLGVPIPSLRRSIVSFPGLEHRLEKVLTFRGVDFVNDSKATTVDATVKALQSFEKGIVLILGGRDKGADFTQLRKPVGARVKKVILLGEARDKIRKALQGIVPLEDASTLRQAVSLSFSRAAPGEMVLLAPACTSFDLFKNFEARGRAFKREVLRLKTSLQREKR